MVSIAVMTLLSHLPATTTYTPEEVVTACLIAEAGGEGDRGMYAVLSVIRNRAGGKTSVKKWQEVVTKKKQFSCFNSGVNAAVSRAKTHPKWDDAKKIVATALANPNMEDYSKGATHYHVCVGPSKVSPSWTHPNFGGKNKKCVVTTVIGRHVFLSHVD